MITSTANAKVKRLVNLRKKRRARDEEKVFLVEGIRMFAEIPPKKLREVYVTESFYHREKQLIDRVLSGTRTVPEVLSDQVFAYASDTKTPQGILCVVSQMGYGLSDVLEGACPYVLVLDNLQDPGNLGTIVRTAEGAGITGIVMSRDCVDILNPKTIRATMGSICRMPFYYAEDFDAAIREIKAKGIHTYAAHLDGARAYDGEDYRRPCAFFIGNEGNGLRDEVAGQADTCVKIAMEGQVESLNAAIAAAVLMFEGSRQRRNL